MKKKMMILAIASVCVFSFTACSGDAMPEVEQQLQDQASDPDTGNDGDGPDIPPPSGN